MALMDDLIQSAKNIIEKRYCKGKHSVGAAVRTKDGKVFTGVCLNSQKLDVCAEWTTIGRALSEGETDFDMIVAVHRTQEGEFEIYPPCSLCRELYLTYCPDIRVLLPGNQVVEAVDLLPHAWQKKRK